MAEADDHTQPIFSRLITIDDEALPDEGRIDATPDELAQLTTLLKIEALHSFSLSYRIEARLNDRVHVTGNLAAALTQLCVVTLEPVAEQIDEAVAIDFWPEEQITTDSEDDPDLTGDILAEDPPEPISGGKIDLGAVAAEILASAINPYPRKSDAEFTWQDPAETGMNNSSSSPFAALGKLKSKD